MLLIPIRGGTINPGDDLIGKILQLLEELDVKPRDGDVLAIPSKVVATIQNRIVKLECVAPSKEAVELAEKYRLEPKYVEIVLKEADKVYGGVYKSLLTLKDNSLIANAGVDQKNAPKGYVTLLPRDPIKTAEELRRNFTSRTGTRIGVIIVDSHVTPLRMGTTGYALAVSGFKPVIDLRSKPDLYGRRIEITRHSIADDLSSAAHALMGEADERVIAVLIRDAPIELNEENQSHMMYIEPKECLFTSTLLKYNIKSSKEHSPSDSLS